MNPDVVGDQAKRPPKWVRLPSRRDGNRWSKYHELAAGDYTVILEGDPEYQSFGVGVRYPFDEAPTPNARPVLEKMGFEDAKTEACRLLIEKFELQVQQLQVAISELHVALKGESNEPG